MSRSPRQSQDRHICRFSRQQSTDGGMKSGSGGKDIIDQQYPAVFYFFRCCQDETSGKFFVTVKAVSAACWERLLIRRSGCITGIRQKLLTISARSSL